MDDTERKKAFIQGFRDGVTSTFKEVEKMVARGYTSQELRMMLGSRKAAILKDIEDKMEEMGMTEGTKERVEPSFPVLEKGESLIFLENETVASMQYLNRLTKSGADLLAFIRSEPARFQRELQSDKAVIKWLASPSKGTTSRMMAIPLGMNISPDEITQDCDPDDFCIKPTDLSRIDVEAKNFFQKGEGQVVYLEGVEFLVTQNDFKKILKMIQHIRETAVMQHGNLIISMDKHSLDSREISLIVREMTHKFDAEQ